MNFNTITANILLILLLFSTVFNIFKHRISLNNERVEELVQLNITRKYSYCILDGKSFFF
jgi:hypothetical protein